MGSYWFNLIYLGSVWALAFVYKSLQRGISTVDIGLTAIFFSVYFAQSLFKEKKSVQFVSYVLLDLIVFALFMMVNFNWYALLILIVLTYDVNQSLNNKELIAHMLVQGLLLVFARINSGVFYENALIFMVMLLAYCWIIIWGKESRTYKELVNSYDSIQSDYRRMKRMVVINEKNLRQDERNQIAREIHDSVGHQLTALLMQLEVLRIQIQDDAFLEKIGQLKSLAQESLSETRKAVKALKNDETIGLNAVMQLIRKLESESHLQIEFLVKSGALSFPLNSKQSVVLYRCIQESLTNMMRHSDARQATVEFDVIGGNFFRFHVSNPLKNSVVYEEGFGLSSMRERVVELGGTLNVTQNNHRFTIVGVFPMEGEV